MKRSLPSVPQLYRNVRRWTEIVSVLSKYGLAGWLSRFNIDFLTDLLRTRSHQAQSSLNQRQRIRLALTELGPTFIKFGQLLSTRADLVGPDLAEELALLQSETPSDDFDSIRQIIEQDQGQTLEEIFVDFDPVPIASASIGQTHLARIRPEYAEGQETGGLPIDVVVKVQHAGIQRLVETDLDILAGLAQLAERLEDFRHYQPTQVVRQMSRLMRRELDFGREERNLMQFRTLLEDEPDVVVPETYPELCSPRMITMQRIVGPDIRATARQNLPAERLSEIARCGANIYLKMIFEYGFYHADPHPGNIVITPEGRIGLLDFGMVGRISERLREDIESMLVAIVGQDVAMLTLLIKRIGHCPLDLDEAALSNDIADFVGQYSTQVVSHFDMSGALHDFVELVRRYEITLPGEAALLIKVLITLEGTGRLLNPRFSLMEIMKPYQRRLVLKRLSPGRQVKKMRRFYMELEQLIDALPNRLTSILEQVQTGRFDVHLVHRRLGPTANRLVMGLMTSALFLGSSLMLSYQVPPLLFPGEGPLGIRDLSVLGFVCLIASLMMGLRLTWAIRKSGNLDQPE